MENVSFVLIDQDRDRRIVLKRERPEAGTLKLMLVYYRGHPGSARQCAAMGAVWGGNVALSCSRVLVAGVSGGVQCSDTCVVLSRSFANSG
jgi:hypothetical protein